MELLDKGVHVDFNQAKDCDCHIVGSILKTWLKQLPNPVLTFELYDAFMQIQDSGIYFYLFVVLSLSLVFGGEISPGDSSNGVTASQAPQGLIISAPGVS